MRRTNFLRTSGVAAAVILLSGCVLPPVITLASIAADFASYGETGKTISDHGLSFVMQKDCAMLRVLDNEKPVCVEEDEAATATASNESKDADDPARVRAYRPDDLADVQEDANRALPRPFIAEMGGKNPALVMRSADLDKAADGVKASAFGLQGQKCSACSRVYVERTVREAFTEALVEKTVNVRIGYPLERDVWLGPVISEAAYERYRAAVFQAVGLRG